MQNLPSEDMQQLLSEVKSLVNRSNPADTRRLEDILQSRLQILSTASESDQLAILTNVIQAIRDVTKSQHRKIMILIKLGKIVKNKKGINRIIWGGDIVTAKYPKITPENIAEFKKLLGLTASNTNAEKIRTNSSASDISNVSTTSDISVTSDVSKATTTTKQSTHLPVGIDKVEPYTEKEKEQIFKALKKALEYKLPDAQAILGMELDGGPGGLETNLKAILQKKLNNSTLAEQELVLNDFIQFLRNKFGRVTTVMALKAAKNKLHPFIYDLGVTIFGNNVSLFAGYPLIDMPRLIKLLNLTTAQITTGATVAHTANAVQPTPVDNPAIDKTVVDQKIIAFKLDAVIAAPDIQHATGADNTTTNTETPTITTWEKIKNLFAKIFAGISSLFDFTKSSDEKIKIISHTPSKLTKLEHSEISSAALQASTANENSDAPKENFLHKAATTIRRLFLTMHMTTEKTPKPDQNLNLKNKNKYER